MGTIGKRRNKEEERKEEWKNERKGLTLTGLLMEGTNKVWGSHLFGGRVNKGGDVAFQLGEILLAEVHHMAGLVVFVVNIFPQVFGQAEMVGGVLGFEEGRGQVIIAIFHFHLQARIVDDGLGHVLHDAR
jgi:hypothetical protein